MGEEEDQAVGHQEVGREAVHHHHLPGALGAVRLAPAISAVLALAAAIVAAVVLLQHSQHLVGGEIRIEPRLSKARELELLLVDFWDMAQANSTIP